MVKPTAYILVGVPGTGKSTWRAQHMASTSRPTTILSSDDIVDAYAAERGISYTEAWPQVSESDIKQALSVALGEAIERGDDIIVDRTNMTAKSRRSWLARLPRTYRRVAVLFALARDVLNERLEKRAQETGKHIPTQVVDDMLGRFERPTLEEFDEIISNEVPA